MNDNLLLLSKSATEVGLQWTGTGVTEREGPRSLYRRKAIADLEEDAKAMLITQNRTGDVRDENSTVRVSCPTRKNTVHRCISFMFAEATHGAEECVHGT